MVGMFAALVFLGLLGYAAWPKGLSASGSANPSTSNPATPAAGATTTPGKHNDVLRAAARHYLVQGGNAAPTETEVDAKASEMFGPPQVTPPAPPPPPANPVRSFGDTVLDAMAKSALLKWILKWAVILFCACIILGLLAAAISWIFTTIAVHLGVSTAALASFGAGFKGFVGQIVGFNGVVVAGVLIFLALMVANIINWWKTRAGTNHGLGAFLSSIVGAGPIILLVLVLAHQYKPSWLTSLLVLLGILLHVFILPALVYGGIHRVVAVITSAIMAVAIVFAIPDALVRAKRLREYTPNFVVHYVATNVKQFIFAGKTNIRSTGWLLQAKAFEHRRDYQACAEEVQEFQDTAGVPINISMANPCQALCTIGRGLEGDYADFPKVCPDCLTNETRANTIETHYRAQVDARSHLTSPVNCGIY